MSGVPIDFASDLGSSPATQGTARNPSFKGPPVPAGFATSPRDSTLRGSQVERPSAAEASSFNATPTKGGMSPFYKGPPVPQEFATSPRDSTQRYSAAQSPTRSSGAEQIRSPSFKGPPVPDTFGSMAHQERQSQSMAYHERQSRTSAAQLGAEPSSSSTSVFKGPAVPEGFATTERLSSQMERQSSQMSGSPYKGPAAPRDGTPRSSAAQQSSRSSKGKHNMEQPVGMGGYDPTKMATSIPEHDGFMDLRRDDGGQQPQNTPNAADLHWQSVNRATARSSPANQHFPEMEKVLNDPETSGPDPHLRLIQVAEARRSAQLKNEVLALNGIPSGSFPSRGSRSFFGATAKSPMKKNSSTGSGPNIGGQNLSPIVRKEDETTFQGVSSLIHTLAVQAEHPDQRPADISMEQSETSMDPQQWAESLAKKTGGDWWVDAVIIGRLGRLAAKYSSMRCVHRPFVAWKNYLLVRKHKKMVEKEYQQKVALRSWRFRSLVRNDRTGKIWKGAHQMKKIVRSRMKYAWKILQGPVLIGRSARQSAAMCKLLRTVMMNETARTFCAQKSLTRFLGIWRAMAAIGDEKERLEREKKVIERQMSNFSKAETDEMLQTRPFILTVLRRGWCRWQRAVKWWLSPHEWDLWHHEAYFHGETKHPPRTKKMHLHDHTDLTEKWQQHHGHKKHEHKKHHRHKQTHVDDEEKPALHLKNYYEQVLGNQTDWLPFPDAKTGSPKADEYDEFMTTSPTNQGPSANGKLKHKHHHKFSSKLRTIAHKTGSTCFLTNKKITNEDKLKKQLVDVSATVDSPKTATASQLYGPGLKKFSPRTQLIMKRMDARKRISAPLSEKEHAEWQHNGTLSDDEIEFHDPESARERPNPATLNAAGDEEEDLLFSSPDDKTDDDKSPYKQLFRPISPGQDDESAYNKLKRSVMPGNKSQHKVISLNLGDKRKGPDTVDV